MLCLDLVIVAHSHNLIRFDVSGNSVRSGAWVSPRTEERLFGQVRSLECDKRKDLVCWVDKKVNAIRYRMCVRM